MTCRALAVTGVPTAVFLLSFISVVVSVPHPHDQQPQPPQQHQPSPTSPDESMATPEQPAPWAFMDSYPRQYITHRLQATERIEIDGKLDEPAWAAVNWTEPMEDIAQVRNERPPFSLKPLCSNHDDLPAKPGSERNGRKTQTSRGV